MVPPHLVLLATFAVIGAACTIGVPAGNEPTLPGAVAAGSERFSSTLRMPYASGNFAVKYTGGPHQWSHKPYCVADVSKSSGIDFGAGGQPFEVLAVASGTLVAKNFTKEDMRGPGFWVIIDHGNIQTEYWHLESESSELHTLEPGKTIPRGFVLGTAGKRGGQDNVHLHLELSQGRKTPSGRGGVGWDGRLIDGWTVHEHRLSSAERDGYSYQGTATLGTAAPYAITLDADDCGDVRKLPARAIVASDFKTDFERQPVSDCVTTKRQPCTVFAATGSLGVHLPSTNVRCADRQGCPIATDLLAVGVPEFRFQTFALARRRGRR